MRFLSEGDRGELIMTARDRVMERLAMSLHVSAPLVVGAVLMLSGETDPNFVILSMVFIAVMAAFLIVLAVAHQPGKIVVDSEGLTKEMFWTGRRERYSFGDIKRVSRYAPLMLPRIYCRIDLPNGTKWIACDGRDAEREAEFDRFVAFVIERWSQRTGEPVSASGNRGEIACG